MTDKTPEKQMQEIESKSVNVELPTPEELFGITDGDDNEGTQQEVETPVKAEPALSPIEKEEAYEEDEPEEQKEIPEKTSIEDTARSMGWVPKDDFKGNPEDWRSAREFVDRGELIDQIKKLSKNVKEKDKTNEQLLNLLQSQAERRAQYEMEKIKQQKFAAIQDGDVEAVEKYQQEYEAQANEYESFKQLRKTIDSSASEVPNKLQPQVQEFVERNSDWFNNETADNAAMVAYAQKKDSELAHHYPDWSLERRLYEIEKLVKTTFNDRFQNPNVMRPTMVEKPHKIAPKKRELGYKDLPQEAKKIINGIMRNVPANKFNKDELAREMFESGAITLE